MGQQSPWGEGNQRWVPGHINIWRIRRKRGNARQSEEQPRAEGQPGRGENRSAVTEVRERWAGTRAAFGMLAQGKIPVSRAPVSRARC